jgi:DNA-binding MarR family transcriptional regulator
MSDETMSLVQERSRDPVLLTWYRFIRVLRKIVYLMDEPMQGLDVSRSQFDLLMQVAFEEGINQKTCAERMNVTKGNITQHIDRLEKGGLIQRQKEGRINSLYLTEAGKDLVSNIMPIHDRRVKEILSVLSQEELQRFQSILRKFDRSLT